MKFLSSRVAATSLACAFFLLACGGDDTATGGGGTTSTTPAGGGGQGGEAGGKPTCADVLCSGPGEICQDGECLVDCRRTGSQPCPDDTYCDASDASPGQCVGLGSPCLTTSGPQPCGDRVCGPGSICDGAGQCYPRVPCQNVDCDDGSCWGTACACERAIGCSPAPVGMPDETGTLHDPAFRGGLIDLEIDPLCNVWGVTMLSGPDYLRSIAPDGTVSTYPGVTNLNMGEVAALQHIVVPKSATTTFDPPQPPPPDDIDLALTYICCSACGCQLSSTPQGVSHFDPDTGELPLVIPSQTFTDGAGPFGVYFIDTGPAGLSYGTNRVLYVGNVDENGDYHRLDLATNEKTVVTTFPSRVYASMPPPAGARCSAPARRRRPQIARVRSLRGRFPALRGRFPVASGASGASKLSACRASSTPPVPTSPPATTRCRCSPACRMFEVSSTSSSISCCTRPGRSARRRASSTSGAS
jgi:hypothetical protein